MKKLVLVSIFLIAFAGVASAELKIGYINMAYCLENSNAGKSAQEELKAMEASMVKELQPLADEINKMEADYIAQEKVLTDAVKKTRLEALEKKSYEYNSKLQAYSNQMNVKYDEIMNKLSSDLELVVNQLGKDAKYDFILVEQAVLYSKNAVNLNNEVIERYNKQFNAGK